MVVESGVTEGAGPSEAAGDAEGSKKGPTARRISKRTRGVGSKGGNAGKDNDEEALLAMQGFWACDACTTHNEDLSATVCAMCNTPRPRGGK